jgi:hypothetical protein
MTRFFAGLKAAAGWLKGSSSTYVNTPTKKRIGSWLHIFAANHFTLQQSN